MRRFDWICIPCIATFALPLCAETGVAPRIRATDYPVHQGARSVTIGAAVVPPDQVSKLFSKAISNQYVVIEVGIYPDDGVAFDVDSLNFTLRVEGRVSRAERPQDVAPWSDKSPSGSGPRGNLPVNVTTETGVIWEKSNDPVYGRRQGVGTYSGVSVDNYPQPPNAPQQSSGPDPRVLERVKDTAIPEGETTRRVAGYMYFPQSGKRRKNDAIQMDYSKDDVRLHFVFPK